jgi:hypothetical protein
MFLDQLDERNAMMQSIPVFEKVGRESAKLISAGSIPKGCFLRPGFKCNDPSMLLILMIKNDDGVRYALSTTLVVNTSIIINYLSRTCTWQL